MVANFLIGLREGLEASLVVSILVAYLVRTGRRDRLPLVWAGVAAAVGLSVGSAALLTYTEATVLRSDESKEVFAGVLSVVAVGFVTWMIFWMRRASRGIGKELQGKLDAAVAMGSLAVVLMAFLAVAREGLETALFMFTAVQAAGSTVGPLIGFALGIGTSVALGWLLYRKAVTINLATFFKITGVLLIFVAAGVLAYGVHDLQEGGVLPGADSLAFDVTAQVPPGSWYGTLLRGIFNFSPQTTWLQLVVWVGYVVPVLYLFLRPARTPASSPVPARAEAS
ncbi:MAG TPA: iron uptake transporter permease EfeU [Actinomycetes bacterium]